MAQSQISGIINSSIFFFYFFQPSQILNLSTSESSEFHHFSNLAEHTFIIRASVDFAVNYMIFFLTCQHFKFSFETWKMCGKIDDNFEVSTSSSRSRKLLSTENQNVAAVDWQQHQKRYQARDSKYGKGKNCLKWN